MAAARGDERPRHSLGRTLDEERHVLVAVARGQVDQVAVFDLACRETRRSVNRSVRENDDPGARYVLAGRSRARRRDNRRRGAPTGDGQHVTGVGVGRSDAYTHTRDLRLTHDESGRSSRSRHPLRCIRQRSHSRSFPPSDPRRLVASPHPAAAASKSRRSVISFVCFCSASIFGKYVSALRQPSGIWQPAAATSNCAFSRAIASRLPARSRRRVREIACRQPAGTPVSVVA